MVLRAMMFFCFQAENTTTYYIRRCLPCLTDSAQRNPVGIRATMLFLLVNHIIVAKVLRSRKSAWLNRDCSFRAHDSIHASVSQVRGKAARTSARRMSICFLGSSFGSIVFFCLPATYPMQTLCKTIIFKFW